MEVYTYTAYVAGYNNESDNDLKNV